MDTLFDEIESIMFEFGNEYDFFTPNETTLFIVPLYETGTIKICGKNKLDAVRKGYRCLDDIRKKRNKTKQM